MLQLLCCIVVICGPILVSLRQHINLINYVRAAGGLLFLSKKIKICSCCFSAATVNHRYPQTFQKEVWVIAACLDSTATQFKT